MAGALATVGFLLLLGGLVTLAACAFPTYRARHPKRASHAAIAMVVGFILIAGGLGAMEDAEKARHTPPTARPLAVPAPTAAVATWPEPDNSPVGRHPLIVLPLAFAIAIFMVFAMMECTVRFVVRRPRPRTKPVTRTELETRLLALNQRGEPFRLVAGEKCDLELHWDVVDASWHQLFSKVKLTAMYRTRMLFDEPRHEVRWCEWLRTSSFFIGLRGWRPLFNWSFQIQSGYVDVIWSGRAYGIEPGFPPRVGRIYHFTLNTVQAKRDISEVVLEAGWVFRPVLWWFQAGRSRLSQFFGRVARFSPLRGLPEKLTWTLTYVGSYTLLIAYLLWMAGGFGSSELWTAQNIGLLVGITAFWWGIWGLITWLLVVMSRPRRRRKRA